MTEKTESRRSLSIRRIMNYTIFNDFLEVTVSDVGAELMSVKSKKDSTEYLWQGDLGGQSLQPFPHMRQAHGRQIYLQRQDL